MDVKVSRQRFDTGRLHTLQIMIRTIIFHALFQLILAPLKTTCTALIFPSRILPIYPVRAKLIKEKLRFDRWCGCSPCCWSGDSRTITYMICNGAYWCHIASNILGTVASGNINQRWLYVIWTFRDKLQRNLNFSARVLLRKIYETNATCVLLSNHCKYHLS